MQTITIEVKCEDDMTKDEVLTFCPACGNNIHTDCMKMWSEHRQGTGEVVTCPLCREAWGPRCVVVLAQACIIFARGHLTYFVAGVYSALRGMVEQKKEEKRLPAIKSIKSARSLRLGSIKARMWQTQAMS